MMIPGRRDEMYEVVDALPERRKGGWRVDWDEVKAVARANPGRWIRVGALDPSVATHIRAGRYKSILPDEFEVTTRKIDDATKKSWLYVKTRDGSEG